VGGVVVPQRALYIEEIVHKASAEECYWNPNGGTITFKTVSTAISYKLRTFGLPVLNFYHTGKLNLLILLLKQLLEVQPRISIITLFSIYL